ncbi:MAG: OmpA family protein [Bacteroidales bacterium]
MNALKLMFASVLCLTFSVNINAQLLQKVTKNAQKKIEREAERRTEQRVNKSIDNAFDKTEDEIDNAVKGNKKSKKIKQSKEKQSSSDTQSKSSVMEQEKQSAETPVLTWTKYDFVPGTEIIFIDNQQSEQSGEFPSKWDLVSGTIENARFGDDNVILFRETGNFPNGIVPLLKNPSADDLPDEFTVEFDAYFEKGKYSNYYVFFYDAKNKSQKKLRDLFVVINVNHAKYGYSDIENQLENTKFSNKDNESAHWRHVAISFNKRAMKVYLDETRLLNIPNITDNPTGITIGVNHASIENNEIIKNIRIAKGAVPLYDKVFTDGKFVTTGITFDVNKATIKPESMGAINYVFKMMQDNPDLRFSIEGHTDSDGDETMNQTLSEQRALSVRAQLIKLGIAADRLTTKGWGESVPMVANDSPEGKAQNRRVEFIKL